MMKRPIATWRGRPNRRDEKTTHLTCPSLSSYEMSLALTLSGPLYTDGGAIRIVSVLSTRGMSKATGGMTITWST